VKTPGTGWQKVYFTAALEVFDASARAWVDAPVTLKPWYYHYANSSGQLYPGWVWMSSATNRPVQPFLNFAGLSAGYYRMDLNFYWSSDGRQAVYQTDACKVG
jgi:hypothetical protein